jgi:Helicase conserved C-terminal domain
LTDHIARRAEVLAALVEELLGPAPRGEPIDCSEEIRFAEVKDAFASRTQADTGDEILVRDRPTKRYGVGVLSPPALLVEEGAPEPGETEPGAEEQEALGEARESADEDDALSQAGADRLRQAAERIADEKRADDDDYELASVNSYRPSTMAVTFLANLPEGGRLQVRATGGRYVRKEVAIPGGTRVWWLRKPVEAEATFEAKRLIEGAGRRVEPDEFLFGDSGPLKLEVVAYPRAREQQRQTLVTVCLVNRSETADDDACLFQTTFAAEVVSGDGAPHILAYPDPEGRARDDEEESLDLLYREAQTFAVGHGCAADWSKQDAAHARTVTAVPLPVFEAPNISADILLADGSKLEVSMAALAGLIDGDDGRTAVAQLLDLYEAWIGGEWKKVRGEGGHDPLPERYQGAAARHLGECEQALERMRQGLKYLDGNERAAKAFRLANHAVLLQQLRTRRSPRRRSYDKASRQLVFDEPLVRPDPLSPPAGRGMWRPFQIAFLLCSLQSVAEPAAADRSDVELIWFPTGGGKTEAYLALTAFSLFYRRLCDREDAGVDVLMRYTLRLLTAQQFQRASALICAMEHLRQQDEEALGYGEFSIGLWLGGSVSPNRREDARAALRELKRGDDENVFVVMRCPWCAAQMGQVKYTPPGGGRQKTVVSGYTESEGTVKFQCPDKKCDFANHLPLYVVDDDIYKNRPSLVIGTVDKFAQLAWQPEARHLFGIDPDGERQVSPPNLIIQDELHLISGPLGSMVGIYEGAIDALCLAGSDRQPKIISSTATIRRYEQQIRDLYARESVYLFPPRGLDAGDSFFAQYARGTDGTLLPGRMYVGIHGPGLGSVQTVQVRTFSALLQAPATLDDAEKDPWWTLMVFFNSLRELGTSLSLLQSDIPDYLWALRNRLGLPSSQARRLRNFLELTGRLRNDEVPKAMEQLEVETTTGESTPVDVCLASNIIEVGIDIDRLSLMCVVGQPKTTSQYIQVTGRVGRKWEERPALVATVYSASKPRDRSHFEKFRSYHERLYAQVEPTSVTPFSPPVVERAVHAVIAAFVRQAGTRDEAESPYPFPEAAVEKITRQLANRVAFVDHEEQERFDAEVEKRIAEWKRWQRTNWRRQRRDDDFGLLRVAGAYASAEESQLSWPTPNSLRAVDAECESKITTLYLRDDEDDEEDGV